jgi:hypothetical protein
MIEGLARYGSLQGPIGQLLMLSKSLQTTRQQLNISPRGYSNMIGLLASAFDMLATLTLQ